MDIYNARLAESGQLRMRHVVRGLIPPAAVDVVASEFKTEGGSLKTERLAYELSGLSPSKRLTGLQYSLGITIRKTLVQIRAEMHSRLVFAIGCVPMILIGIGLGIIKKGGHLLSAFAASCVPAAVLAVCIISGQHITENLDVQAVSGIALMWTGLGFLSLLAVGIYYWLSRN